MKGHLKDCKESCTYNPAGKCLYGGWNSHGKCFLEWEENRKKEKAARPIKKYKRNKDIYDFQETYERWWLDKNVLLSTGEVKKVVKITLNGPPSFVYGGVTLHFKDGNQYHVPHGGAFRPRKSDVIIVKD